ncbi:MAG: hypothetical protein KJN93_09065 [Alphaproteobacteria bacterium]|nr:hypothetical protein [Alphaproteobacteria bacterium]
MIVAILIVGLLLPVFAGVIARSVLQVRGVSVVSWTEGAALLVPLAIWAAIPFAALAFVLRRMLRDVAAKRPELMPAWISTAIGAALGLVAFQGYTLFDMMTYSGPGGFAEVVSMTLVLWMLTVPFALAMGAIAAGVGGVLGRLVWEARLWRRRNAG